MDGSTATLDEVEAWLRARLSRRGRPKVIIDRPVHGGETVIRLRLWTTMNVYSITAKPKRIVAKSHCGGESKVLRGYLGCGASQRAPRPGEDHTRGNDLADGELDDETLNAILADIVSYESLEIPKAAVPVPVVTDQPSGPAL